MRHARRLGMWRRRRRTASQGRVFNGLLSLPCLSTHHIMRFSAALLSTSCAALASARIVNLASYDGTYQASNTSTFPLTFTTENSQSP